MIAYPAHELAETRDCKIPSCTLDASDAPTTGPYANRCASHREDIRRQLTAPRGPRGPYKKTLLRSEDAPTPAPPGQPSSLKEAAQKLVPVAADLDKALLRKRAAYGEAKRCFEAFKAAFEEIQATAKRALEQ